MARRGWWLALAGLGIGALLWAKNARDQQLIDTRTADRLRPSAPPNADDISVGVG